MTVPNLYGAPPAQDDQQQDPNAIPLATSRPLRRPDAGVPLAGRPAPSTPQSAQNSVASVAAASVPLAQSQPYASLPSSSSPSGSYVNRTIQPGPATDRIALATRSFDTFQRATDPAYKASLDAAAAKAASVGQLGSGQLRTSIGDLASNRALALDTERQSLLDKAISDSIADQYANIGIAQQQQGFQAGREDAAAAQRLAEAGLTGSLGGAPTLAGQQLELARSGQNFSQNLATQQQKLSEQLGLGSLSLQEAQQKLNTLVQTGQLSLAQAQQALAEKQNTQSFGLATRAQDLSEKTQATNAALAERGQSLAETTAAQNFGLAQRQQSLSEQIGLGNLSLAQAQQRVDELVRTGQLSVAQADQALREKQNEQQFGLQSRAQDLQSEQFKQTLASSLAQALLGKSDASSAPLIQLLLQALGFGTTIGGSGASGGSSGGSSGQPPTNTFGNIPLGGDYGTVPA